jgi:hypothetical protein
VNLLERLRRLHPLRIAVAVPLVIFAVVMLGFIVRGWHSADVPDLHAPADVASGPPETAPTSVPDLVAVQLQPVDGTTTQPAPRATGAAHLSGGVSAPDGIVPGAVVRAERVLDDGDLQRFDVVAGADGHWDLPNVPGGRYRVRAFLPPSLAQTDAEVLFIGDAEQRTVDLTVDRFDSVALAGSVAPDPPVAGSPVNLVVQVVVREVDKDGFVRSTPTPGYIVSITNPGSWTLRGSGQVLTGPDGQATFELQCRAAGANQVQVVARTADPAKPPVEQSLGMPDCVEPAAPATTAPTAPPPTTVPGGPTTTQPTTTTTK